MKPLTGTISLPSDKSITHRAILFSALAEGVSTIKVNGLGRDNLASARAMQSLGVKIEFELAEPYFSLANDEKIENVKLSKTEESTIRIHGKGLQNFSEPKAEIYCGNSGTTARLLTGILATQPFSSTLTGDQSLSVRPFKRVVEPLSLMGAKFSGDKLPLTISGGKLTGINYQSPKASAQVKSAVLLAGLVAEGEVSVTEPQQSRDHTERMLSAMGCQVKEAQVNEGSDDKGLWKVELPEAGKRLPLSPLATTVPGDFSSAGFFMVAASVAKGSEVRIENVGINATRIGLLTLLQRMGGKIQLAHQRLEAGEDVADLIISGSELSAIEVSPEDVVLAIDEIPILSLALAFAKGTSVISGAEELRVKESDRLKMICELLEAFKVSFEEKPDGLVIHGNPDLAEKLKGQEIDLGFLDNCHDHRILMSASIFGYLTSGQTRIVGVEMIETSFPSFSQCFQVLTGV